MAQPRRTRASAVLDRESFLQAVQRRLDNGAASFADAVRRAVARRELDPSFTSEALMTGLIEIAREHLGTEERERIIRSVSVRRTLVEEDPTTITVSVTRSELRDWPVITVAGYKRLEDCTIEEAEAQIQHFTQTIDGLARRRTVVEHVVTEARNAGVELIGELPDETLNECLLALGES